MARIHKIVKSYGSKTIGTSTQTLDKQVIKPSGDVISWQLYCSLTTVAGTGTYLASSGTPAGALGANVLDLFNEIRISDNSSVDVFKANREEIYFFSYLLASVETDEFMLNRGGCRVPTIDTASVTANEYVFNIPQRIAQKDLPATIDITLGVLDDYYNVVGTGSATLNQIEIWVRYAPTSENSFTERVRAYQLGSTLTTKSDVAQSIPETIFIHKMAITVDNLAQADGVPTNDDLTRLTSVKFKRGVADEIDAVRTEVLTEFNNSTYPHLRRSGDMSAYAVSSLVADAPLGMVVIPTLGFQKTPATELELDVSGTIQPVFLIVYQ